MELDGLEPRQQNPVVAARANRRFAKLVKRGQWRKLAALRRQATPPSFTLQPNLPITTVTAFAAIAVHHH